MGSPVVTPMSDFARTIYKNKYAHRVNGRKEEWPETAERVARCVMDDLLPDLRPKVQKLIEERKFIPGGRYLYTCGRPKPFVNNCFLLRAHDSREGWGNLADRCINALMVGGGIGVVYSDVRPYGYETRSIGGVATGPCSLASMINEQGRRIMQGGSRRSAIWAGMHWWHPDIFKFIGAKDWPELVREGKRQDFNFPAELDMTNISVILDDDFFEAYHTPGYRKTLRMWGTSFEITNDLACDVYWTCVRGMLRSGEPGFSIDIGPNAGENLRNACVEVCSRDDGDMCNLGSANLSRYESRDQFADDVPAMVAFLICGTIMSHLPLPQMYAVREKNRRVGLGLMGVHEWLLKHNYRYEWNSEIERWMEAYLTADEAAARYSGLLDVSRPVATRSIAPTGTISIIAETTSGIEPILAVAQKRRYLDGTDWKAQYIVDPTAHRLIQNGSDPSLIEDSMTLAADAERRIAFQGQMQRFVDHGISSTLNLPPWGSDGNGERGVTKFGNTLLKYLPQIRGITTYPDGSRDGQPLNPVAYEEAVKQLGVEFIDQGECRSGVCGS